MTEASNPRSPLGPEKLLEKALRLLSSRDYSVAELQTRLLRYAANADDVQRVLEQLRSVRFVDDRAVADRKSARAKEQLLGRRRVEQELLALQLEREIIAETVESHYEAVDEDSLALCHLEQKLASLLRAGQLEDPKHLQRAYGRLRRAGFGHTACVHALRRHSKLAEQMDDSVPDEGEEFV
jgi:SOS response regulatory protein OraA/RecX